MLLTANIITSLTRLKPGEKGKVHNVSGEYKNKLEALGIYSGVQIKLEKNKPAYIVGAGQTRIIMEAVVADSIYVMPQKLPICRKKNRA